MSPVNFNLTGAEYMNLGNFINSGCFGNVYAIGPHVVKVGAVSRREFRNLMKARKLMGDDTFPEPHKVKMLGWSLDGERYSYLIMDKIPNALGTARYDWDLEQVHEILKLYGMRHTDLHYSNIIVTEEGKLHVIDGDMMRFDDEVEEDDC